MATVRDEIKIDASLEDVGKVLDRLFRESGGEDGALDDAVGWRDVGESHFVLGLVNQPAQQKRVCRRVFERDFLLEGACACFSLEGDSQGTVVRMDITYQVVSPGFVVLGLLGGGKRLRVSLGPLGRFMLFPSMGKLLSKAVRDTLAGIKVQVEAGETAFPEIPAAAAPPVA